MHGLRTAIGWIPLTPTGALVGLGGMWAWYGYGLGRGDLVLRTLGSVALAVLALAMISTVLAALRLRSVLLARRDTPELLELEVGHAGNTGFAAKVAFLLPLVDATVTWEAPNVAHKLVRVRGAYTERVTPKRRGEHERIRRRVTVEDHLGLARVRFRAEERRRLRFLPSVGALKNIHVVQGITGGDGMAHPDGPPSGDPMDIRHYGEGDPIRFVLWKVFAKSRTLVVRTPERAISPEKRTVAYLVSGPRDQAAAGAARVAVETRALGNKWKLACDGTDESANTRHHAMELILRSAHCPEEQAGAGLGRFLQSLEGQSRRAVVFVPPTTGPWIERVLAVCGPEHMGGAQLDFVVCTDGIGAPTATRGSWLVRGSGAPSDTADPDELAKVLRRLAGAGKVMVLDRTTGEVHPESHLAHLIRGTDRSAAARGRAS